MSLLSSLPSLSDLTNTIKNPFSADVTSPFMGADFPEGFLIEEVNGAKEKVRLVGNMMPKIPFVFGGQQRIKKDYYAGHSEPVTQVLGSMEDDVTINGTLKDKTYANEAYYGASTEIQQQIDAIRLRGNLCRFALGEWERYGYIQKTVFNMNKLSYVDYAVTFLIVGFNAPTNARYLQKQRLVPFAINKSLIDAVTSYQEEFGSNIPDTVPQSISDKIDAFTSDIAGEIAKVTGLVDQVVDTVGDIKKSINRILGLVKNTQNKINSYKKFLGATDPFDTSVYSASGITGRYSQASFYSAAIAGASGLSSILNRYRDQFKAIADTTPLGRHFVIEGDNLQKISSKFYGTADIWKEIKEYNNLVGTELVKGTILEIPRI